MNKFSIIINLLFKLFSSYNRQHNQVPGKFSLNIRNIPEDFGKNYTEQLYSLISYLVVKSEYLPFTVANLNNIDMIPRYIYLMFHFHLCMSPSMMTIQTMIKLTELLLKSIIF